MKNSPSTKTAQAEAGFYARQMRQAERRDLADARQPGLLDEIAMLRIAMRRTMELAGEIEALDQQLGILRALGMAAARLAMLVRTQVLLGGEKKTTIETLLEQALDEVLREFDESAALTPHFPNTASAPPSIPSAAGPPSAGSPDSGLPAALALASPNPAGPVAAQPARRACSGNPAAPESLL